MIRVDQGRLNLNFIVVIFGFFYVELRKFLKRVKTSKGSKEQGKEIEEIERDVCSNNRVKFI